MNDKAFIDTNIFIYLYSEDEEQKQNISQNAVEKYKNLTQSHQAAKIQAQLPSYALSFVSSRLRVKKIR
jgi:predicted nucleic acid-binding protein